MIDHVEGGTEVHIECIDVVAVELGILNSRDDHPELSGCAVEPPKALLGLGDSLVVLHPVCENCGQVSCPELKQHTGHSYGPVVVQVSSIPFFVEQAGLAMCPAFGDKSSMVPEQDEKLMECIDEVGRGPSNGFIG